MSGDPAPSRQEGQESAGTIAGSSGGGYRNDLDTCGAYIPLTEDVSKCLTSRNARNARNDGETETFVPVAFHARQDPIHGPVTPSLDVDGTSVAVAIAENQRGELRTMDVSPSLGGLGGLGGKVGQGYQATLQKNAVRRLTPREWERLQGFPDDYTLIDWRGALAPDGRRYKAIGNSMPVNVMAWLGERIKRASHGT